MARPFAVFDIDGTLIRWQLYHALADELARMGHLDPIQYERVRAARMAWKQRSHDTSFQAYERTLINLIDVAIATIQVEDLELACRSVIATYKDQVYTYTRDFIEELRAKDYLLFAISASQAEIVGMIAKHYKFDDFGGSVYEVKDGYFTGKKELLLSDRKPEYLQQLVEKHGGTYTGSVAVGDSEGDISMLSVVERPIAFNPSKELFAHAQACGWPVVVERKNVIYHLEPGTKGYQLA